MEINKEKGFTKAVGGGIQTAGKEMSNTNDRMALRQQIAGKLRELLPQIGDEIFVNYGFDVAFSGMNHGFGDEKGLAEKVYHSNLKDRFGDRFICGTTNGGIELGEMTTGDLQQLNNILDEKKYSFSKKTVPEKALKPDINQEQELGEAKENLMNTLDSAKKDMGDTILIQPTNVRLAGIDTTVKAVFLAPDGKDGGEFRLAGEDYAVLAVGNGNHEEFDITKILDNVSSVNALTKAVHDAHVIDLEQKSMQAIRDRIVTPSARRFTPDQVETLNRYHQVAAPDKPAGEVFKELLHEVAQDPDVVRKPEKWVTDTAKELNDLAKGITRDQDLGLRR